MKTIVTHSGGFHSDDVFAIAAFQLMFGAEEVNVVRTRDEAVIANADYVVDVGGKYDHEGGRYDHHQLGAPVRENGIPYAGFGLMWMHYGAEICGSEEIAQMIEDRLCQPIDAGDNGVSLYSLNELGVQPFELYNVVASFHPADETQTKDEAFLVAVEFARNMLIRMIAHGKAGAALKQKIKELYEATEDKSILIFDEPVHRNALIEYPEVHVIVYPSDSDEGGWKASVIPVAHQSFENRAQFPLEWAGLRDAELAEISEIPDAVFCHKARFLFAAKSKESAIKAAQMVK